MYVFVSPFLYSICIFFEVKLPRAGVSVCYLGSCTEIQPTNVRCVLTWNKMYNIYIKQDVYTWSRDY